MINRRAIIAGIGILLLFGSVAQLIADTMNFKSKKPLYAAVALNEKGDKILKLAFDESQGTAMGYDTVYADLNFNGNMADDKPMIGKSETRGDYQFINFLPINLPVYYNDKAKGVRNPYRLVLSCNKLNIQGRVELGFSTRVGVGLKNKSGEWNYSFYSSLNVSGNPDEVQTTVLGGKTGIEITTKPEKGLLGIGTKLYIGKNSNLEWLKGGKPTKAHVAVKDSHGKTVHSEDVNMYKLVPG